MVAEDCTVTWAILKVDFATLLSSSRTNRGEEKGESAKRSPATRHRINPREKKCIMRVTQARIINRKRLGHVAWNRGTREQRIRVAYCVCPRVNPINHRLSLRGGPRSIFSRR